MSKKPTPNYQIMFDSAVSFLKSITTTYNKVRREIFEMQMLYVGSDGYFFTNYNEQAYKDLADREKELLAEQIRACEEVERLRGLLNENSNS